MRESRQLLLVALCFLLTLSLLSPSAKSATTTQVIFDDDGVSFWTEYYGNAETNDAVEKKHGSDSYKVETTMGADFYFWHDYTSLQDFSFGSNVSLWIYGENSGATINLAFYNKTHLISDSNFRYEITDDFTGWQLFNIPKSSFMQNLELSWSEIMCVELWNTVWSVSMIRLDYLVLIGEVEVRVPLVAPALPMIWAAVGIWSLAFIVVIAAAFFGGFQDQDFSGLLAAVILSVGILITLLVTFFIVSGFTLL